MAYAGLPPAIFTNNLTNVQLIDDISGSFNGSTQTFALTSNSAPFHAVSARSLIVVLGGIVQKPQVDYTVDGANITFTVAPVSGLTFGARNIYGLNYLDNVNDGVITPAKLSTGGPSWNTSGTVTVSGDLNVVGSFNSGTQGLFWQDNEPANFGNSNDLKIYHNATDNYFDAITVGQKIFFRTSNSTSLDTNALSILSNGNIGIGTTNPVATLTVVGPNGAGLRIDQGNYNYYGAYNHVFRNSGLTSTFMTIDNIGNVGIGTTNPSSKLHVYNGDLELTGGYNLTWGGTFSGGNPTIWGNASNKTIRFAPDGNTTGLVALLGASSSYILGNIGIGTTDPQSKLDVIGDALINSIKAGRGGGNQLTNTAFGYQTLDSNFSGSNNVAVGYRALYVNSSGLYNVAVGTTALNSNTSGEANVAIGQQALYTNTTGIQNTAVGFTSLYGGNGTQNTALGFQTLFSNSNGGTNLALGSGALYSNSTGSSNASLGAYAGYSNTSGSYNVYCGSWVGTTTTVSRRILIGTGTDFSNRFEGPNTASNVQLAIGHNISGTSNYWIVGDSNYNVGIGTATPGYKLEVNGSFAATTKSFLIQHPTKENYKLRHGSLEGPENGVYVRGRTLTNIIELPDYWTGLVDADSITVNLTPIGNRHIWVEEINNNKVYINSEDTIDCFYTVFAERKDVEKLIVEIEEN